MGAHLSGLWLQARIRRGEELGMTTEREQDLAALRDRFHTSSAFALEQAYDAATARAKERIAALEKDKLFLASLHQDACKQRDAAERANATLVAELAHAIDNRQDFRPALADYRAARGEELGMNTEREQALAAYQFDCPHTGPTHPPAFRAGYDARDAEVEALKRALAEACSDRDMFSNKLAAASADLWVSRDSDANHVRQCQTAESECAALRARLGAALYYLTDKADVESTPLHAIGHAITELTIALGSDGKLSAPVQTEPE
jgi:hypothetical protein